MENESFRIDDIYVPIKRRKELDQKKVDEIVENMLEEHQVNPIWVRRDGKRLVLVQGLHRLEAARALGETTIMCLLVQARKH